MGHTARRTLCLLALCGARTLLPVAARAQAPSRTIEALPEQTLSALDRSKPFGRIIGAFTLRDGTIVVGDASTSQILFFSKDGKPTRAFGRRGSGPGEFQSMVWMGPCGSDTVAVFDPAQNRVTRLNALGTLLGSVPARPPGPVDVIRDGRSIPSAFLCGRNGVRAVVGWSGGPPPRTVGPHRGSVTIAIAKPGGNFEALGTFPGAERYRYPRADGPRQLGRTLELAIASSRIYVGTADSFLVQSFDFEGRKQVALRHSVSRKPFRAVDRAALKRELGWRFPVSLPRTSLHAAIDAEEFPSHLPAHGRLLVDTEDRLWVEEGRAPSDATRLWWGFDASGSVVGSIRVPAALEVFEIDRDSVLGRWTDDEGGESVRRHKLIPESRL